MTERRMELQLTTRRWTIRIARTKPATPTPSNAPYPMKATTPAGYQPRRATKDVR